MTLREAMREIESHEFAAYLNVANDLRTFLRAAQEQRVIQTLLRELNSREKLLSLLSRVLRLSRRQVDPRYENPWDTALAVYAWLIDRKDSALGKVAAKAVSQAPQCWWATKVSGRIEEQVGSNASSGQYEFTSPSLTMIGQTSNAGEVILFADSLSPSEITITGETELHILTQLNNLTNPAETQRWSLGQADYTVPFQNTGSNMVSGILTS